MDQEIFIKKINILCRISFLLLYASFSFSRVHAQTEGVKEGDRIRVTAPTVESGKIKGTVSSFTSEMLMVSVKDTTLFIPNISIRKLEISTGQKRNTGKGAIIGAVSGGLILGIVSVATNKPCREGDWCFFEMSDGEAFGFGALAGALGGAANGAIIGTFIKTDRWKEVPLNIVIKRMQSTNSYLAREPVISVKISF